MEREERRREAGRMFRRGATQAEVAKKFGVSRVASCKWYAAWDKEGLKGLDSKGPPGFSSALDDKNKKKFKDVILKGPLAAGYGTDLWTLARLAEVLKKTTKVKFGQVRTWQVVRSAPSGAKKNGLAYMGFIWDLKTNPASRRDRLCGAHGRSRDRHR